MFEKLIWSIFWNSQNSVQQQDTKNISKVKLKDKYKDQWVEKTQNPWTQNNDQIKDYQPSTISKELLSYERNIKERPHTSCPNCWVELHKNIKARLKCKACEEKIILWWLCEEPDTRVILTDAEYKHYSKLKAMYRREKKFRNDYWVKEFNKIYYQLERDFWSKPNISDVSWALISESIRKSLTPQEQCLAYGESCSFLLAENRDPWVHFHKHLYLSTIHGLSIDKKSLESSREFWEKFENKYYYFYLLNLDDVLIELSWRKFEDMKVDFIEANKWSLVDPEYVFDFLIMIKEKFKLKGIKESKEYRLGDVNFVHYDIEYLDKFPDLERGRWQWGY